MRTSTLVVVYKHIFKKIKFDVIDHRSISVIFEQIALKSNESILEVFLWLLRGTGAFRKGVANRFHDSFLNWLLLMQFKLGAFHFFQHLTIQRNFLPVDGQTVAMFWYYNTALYFCINYFYYRM